MMRSLSVTLTIALTCSLACATPCLAQQPPPDPPAAEAPAAEPEPARRFPISAWVGPGLDYVVTTNGEASNAWVFRLAVRFPPTEGFSPAFSFGWFNTDIENAQFGRVEEIGKLQIRPVMAGVRYTWIRDAFSYDVAATAGPSFSDFDLSGEIARTIVAIAPIGADANTSLAWKLQAGAWYDLNDRVALRGSIGYFRCEPTVTVTIDGRSRRFSQSANAIQLGASVVYRLF